jgi:hypothetical protein
MLHTWTASRLVTVAGRAARNRDVVNPSTVASMTATSWFGISARIRAGTDVRLSNCIERAPKVATCLAVTTRTSFPLIETIVPWPVPRSVFVSAVTPTAPSST